MIDNSILFKLRFFFATSIMAAGLLIVYFRQVKLIFMGGHPWAYAEWLISYEGGFVRRGLFGTLITIFENKMNNLLLLTLIFTLLIYTILWIFFYWALVTHSFSWSSIFLILNPAGILFLSWNQYLYIRKEIFGLVCLSLITLYYRIGSLNKVFLNSIICLFLTSILVGEINFFLTPAVLYVLYLIKKNFFSIEILIVTTLSIVLMAFSAMFHGSYEIAYRNCAKLVALGFEEKNICGGAIDSLMVNLSDAVGTNYDNLVVNLSFIPIGLLTFLPFILSWNAHYKKALLIGLLGIFPLFIIAWDYGRWLSLAYSSAVILLLSNLNLEDPLKKMSPFFIVFYVTIWGYGHTGGDVLKNGWIAALPRIFNELILPLLKFLNNNYH